MRNKKLLSTVGVTGVIMEGRGDLIYLSIIYHLLKNYKISRVICQLQIEDGNLIRANEVKNFLIEEKLIENLNYSGKTPKALFASILINNPNMRLFTEQSSPFPEPNVLFWIHVSVPTTFTTHPEVGFLEMNVRGEGITGYFTIGLPILSIPLNKTCGFFLKNEMRGIENLDTQSVALFQIKDPLFNLFLHGEYKPSLESCRSFLKRNIIINGYFRSKNISVLVKAFCLSDYVLASKKNVVLTMNKSLGVNCIQELKQSGFNVIRSSFWNQNELHREDKIKKNAKTIFLVENHFFSKEDFKNLQQTGDVCFVSGDNTFQEAVSRGALPIFDLPSHKIEFPARFANYLQLKFPGLTQFADFFRILAMIVKLGENEFKKSSVKKLKRQDLVRFFLHSQLPKRQRLIVMLAKVINHGLLLEWQVICQYLIKNHNLYDNFSQIIRCGLSTQLDKCSQMKVRTIFRQPIAPTMKSETLTKSLGAGLKN